MKFEQMHPADQLVEMMNRIYKHGMTTTSGGNLSIRDEKGDIWITPSGVDKGNLTRDDIMQVRPDGTYVGKHEPSVELPFHRDIYGARPELCGVVHAHPPVMVGFSVLRQNPDVRILPEAFRICGNVAQVPYDVAGSLELDANINARFREGYSTVLMANHGVVCGAKDLQQAFVAFETITRSGEIEMNAARLGGAQRLSEEQLKAAEDAGALPEMAAEAAGAGEQAARESICAYARRCYERRLVSAAQGSISLRLADGSMLITPGDKDMLKLRPQDIVRVKNGCCEGGGIPGEKARLHMKVYEKQSDVQSIIISHGPSIMGFAVAGKEFDSRTMSEGYVILGEAQRAAYGTGADKIAGMFGYRKNIVLVDNSCAIVTGASMHNAFDRAEVLEYGAASLIAAHAIGAPIALSRAEIDHTNQVLGL